MRFLDETNLFTREDTFFGVCQGLGEDLGISPNWFRLALALGLFFSPLGTLAAYALMGVFVFAIRWLVPAPSAAPAAPASAETPVAAAEVAPEPVALAA